MHSIAHVKSVKHTGIVVVDYWTSLLGVAISIAERILSETGCKSDDSSESEVQEEVGVKEKSQKYRVYRCAQSTSSSPVQEAQENHVSTNVLAT